MSSLSFGQYSNIKCEYIEGQKVVNIFSVASDFTGLAFECRDDMVYKLASYKGGKLDGNARFWREGGQLSYEHNYKDGKEDGAFRAWYSNGQLWYEENYKQGKKEGVQYKWCENGQLLSEQHYEDGKLLDDKVVHYNCDGNIKFTEYYEKGGFVRCEGDCD